MTPRKYLLITSSLLLMIAFTYSAFLLPYVRAFHIRGDDFALILNSARQYHPNPALWVTRGFSSYFIAFPDLPHHHTDFCRPLVNVTFWLESLLSPGTGRLNLTTNYLGLAIVLILFMFFARRETSGKVLFPSSMLIAYAFSAVWYEEVMSPSSRGSLLMVLFALAAFLLLPPGDSRHQGLRVTLSVFCQLASLLSHETGLVTPVIAALLFLVRRDGKPDRGRLKVLPVFLLPLLCFAALRLTYYGGVRHTYVLEPQHGWVRTGIVNGLELLAKPFFPWTTDAVTSGEVSLAVAIGLLMNLAGYALSAFLLLRPGKAGRGPILRVLLCLGTALTVLWIAPTVRFMPLAAVFGALAIIVAAEQVSQSAQRSWVPWGMALGVLGLAAGQLVVFLSSFPQTVATWQGGSRTARAEFGELQKAIATAGARTLLLVNDRAGWAATGAMLEMAAGPDRHRIGELITVNTLLGAGNPQSSLAISRDDQATRIRVAAAPGQLAFANVIESQLGSKFVNLGLQYEIEPVRTYSLVSRLLRRLGRKVEPDNVSIGRRLVVKVPPETGRNGLLVVGFDPRNMSWFSSELPR